MDGGMADRRRAASRRFQSDDRLHSMLVRCAVQTQLAHYSAFKNQLHSEWLTEFLDHDHLWQRTAEEPPRYDGVLSSGLRCGGLEYLRTMLRKEPQSFEVRYEVTGCIASRPEAAVQGGTSEAAISRRMNPYLQAQEPTYKTYQEVIEPRRIATSLMAVCDQLSEEWTADLQAIACEGDTLQELCSRDELTSSDGDIDLDVAATDVADERPRDLPAPISEAFRAVQGGWSSDGGDAAEEASPFREENFDLLQRTATYQAALELLGAGSPEGVDWLTSRLKQWEARWEEPDTPHLGNVFLVQALQAPPTPKQRADGTLFMASPRAVAAEVLAARERLCFDWLEALPRLQRQRTALVSESFEEALNLKSEEASKDE